MASAEAELFKNEGNNYIKEKDYQKAVDSYSKSITLCPDNYMYYSNRSAAYASLKMYQNAHTDAMKTVELNPNWGKGYSRLGAALEYLGKVEDALEAYKKGIVCDPDNAQLKQAIRNIENRSQGSQQDFLQQAMKDKNLNDIMNDPDMLRIMQQYMSDPSGIMKDPEALGKFSKYFGVKSDTSNKSSNDTTNGNNDISSEFEETSNLKSSFKESEELQAVKLALKEKDIGNQLYKKRQFDEALNHYQKAKELDTSTIIYDLNIAAVYFEQEKYSEAIKLCEETIEHGRSIHAPYESIAKAYSRIGNSYYKMKDYDNALKAYKKSVAEYRDPEVVKRVRESERILKEIEERKFINPEIAEQEKIEGNKLFASGDYPQAIKRYTEAIRRNPNDSKVFSNRAACYTKLMEFHLCIKDCDKSLELDPKFIKSYLRKAGALLAIRDSIQAKAVYEKAIEIDPSNHEARVGLGRCYEAMNQMKPEEAAESALRDPEVQEILNDPSMQIMLETMKNDPQSCSRYMSDPAIYRKIKKLIDAGIVKVGHQ